MCCLMVTRPSLAACPRSFWPVIKIKTKSSHQPIWQALLFLILTNEEMSQWQTRTWLLACIQPTMGIYKMQWRRLNWVRVRRDTSVGSRSRKVEVTVATGDRQKSPNRLEALTVAHTLSWGSVMAPKLHVALSSGGTRTATLSCPISAGSALTTSLWHSTTSTAPSSRTSAHSSGHKSHTTTLDKAGGAILSGL